MDTGRCGTCRHWISMDGPDNPPPLREEDDHYSFVIRDHKKVIAPGRWGFCGAVAEIGPRNANHRFYVIDGSEYAAKMGTREDFGCVEHDPA